MFVTNEWAIAEMNCPFVHGGKVRRKCVGDRCMAWREQTVYASAEKDHRNWLCVKWTLEFREGATPVDCGFCGAAAAPPTISRNLRPLGCDENNLGLATSAQGRTRKRCLTGAEIRLAEKRGQRAALRQETPELPRRSSKYYFPQKGRKNNEEK